MTLIKTNGIRKVREGVNIFDKRILDSFKFISDSASEYGLIYNNLFLAEYKLHGAQSIRILLSMFPREGEEKHRETPLSQHYYVLFFQVGCTAMFYSAQGSVQPQETGESCIST